MRRAGLLWLVAALAGCAGTDVGNPETNDGGPKPDAPDPGGPVLMDIDVVLYTPPSEKRPVLPAGATVDLAWVSLDRIRLRGVQGCEDEVEQDIQGQIPVDMLAPGAPEPLRDIEVAPGGYCRIDIEWGKLDALDGDTPPELLEHSFLIEGQRGDGVRFVLRTDRGDEIRLDAVEGEGFTIDQATHALFVTLDAEVLFAGVDLGSAEVGSDGVIRIDDDNNDDLLDRFEENLDAATSLYDDDDDNGELDDDEHAPGEVLAE